MAPYDKNCIQALSRCFYRNTALPIPPEQLKTYREQLNQYHLHPEDKFRNGDYSDSGFTIRRHVEATVIEHIGKEANRWEEQFYLGGNAEAQIIYGLTPDDFRSFRDNVLQECQQFSQRKLAQASGLSLRQVSRILTHQGEPSLESLTRLHDAIKILKDEEQHTTCSRTVANLVGVDALQIEERNR